MPDARPHAHIPDEVDATAAPARALAQAGERIGVPRRGEAGFSLIELIVAMIIMAILMAVAIPMFLGSKTTTRRKQAAAFAGTYASAVEQFKLDHANMIPKLGSADWPNAANGPVSKLTGSQVAYIKSPPAEMAGTEGDISAAPDGSRLVHLQYVATATGYYFRASGRGSTSKPWDHTTDCIIGAGQGVPTTPKHC